MNWIDTVMIVLSATLANHLGLIDAIEKVIRHKIPVVNCSKCLSFWSVLIYSLIIGQPVIESVAVSFLCAYAALWLELGFGCIDTLYNKIYENTFTSTTERTDAEDTEA